MQFDHYESSKEIQVIEENVNNQTCTYRVLLGGSEFNFLPRILMIIKDSPDNDMSTWEERWSIQKATSNLETVNIVI